MNEQNHGAWMVEHVDDSLMYRCPFCGAVSQIFDDDNIELSDISECKSCGADMTKGTHKVEL